MQQETPAQNFMHRAIILFIVIVPFLATLFAIVLLWQQLVTWYDLALLALFYVISAMGITIGFHRMLTHRSFRAHPVVRFLFLAAGSLALEGSPLYWASTHIQHHAESDEEDDPHSPLHGFVHAHVGWLMGLFWPNPERYGKWLLKDPMVMFFHRTYLLWIILSFALPFALGGWTGLLWGGFVRIFLVHHVTWSVNSICHTFGRREFATSDQSRNQWVVGLLALGEGWHNNHHAFPRSAFHGLRWWQIDLSAYVIMLLEKLRLVQNVQRVSPAMMAARANQTQTVAPPEEPSVSAMQ